MNEFKTVSIVIPTYNRGVKLKSMVDCLLSSDATGLERIEIIVVDDGSTIPASSFVEACKASGPFDLRCLRQANAGPAAARNAGFRSANGEIVIFIDDDIIASSDLLRKHVDAHILHPHSVVCGLCPLVTPDLVTPIFRYVNSLSDEGKAVAETQFVNMEIIASGQISVEREMFDLNKGVYKDDLTTPAAEEFELSLRLRELGVPILQAFDIIALHDQRIVIDSFCRQQYKHAIGCAEAAIKYPETLKLTQLANVINASGRSKSSPSILKSLKLAVKCSLGAKISRKILLNTVQIVERVIPNDSILAPLYRVVIGIHFFAGVRDGLDRYSMMDGQNVC